MSMPASSRKCTSPSLAPESARCWRSITSNSIAQGRRNVTPRAGEGPPINWRRCWAAWRTLMAPDEIAASVRIALADTRVHEVKMFGGIGFMLNGNMLVAVSKRGLLACVGKDAEAEALLRPGARAMEMRG